MKKSLVPLALAAFLFACGQPAESGTVNKDSEDMVNIGAVMEYGATIQHPSGATIIIPARPFLHPVMEKHRKEILENYRKAARSAGL